MSISASREVTTLLEEWAGGNEQALRELIPLVYKELRQHAAGYLRNERPDHTLGPTALVHEAYLRLVEQTDPPCLRNRAHFFGIAARLMRQILVDHARKRGSRKRAGHKVSLEEAISLPGERSADLVAFDNGLKALGEFDPRKCKAVELRYFGGMSLNEIAEVLDLSAKTVSRDLRFAETWLYHEMRRGTRESRTLASD